MRAIRRHRLESLRCVVVTQRADDVMPRRERSLGKGFTEPGTNARDEKGFHSAYSCSSCGWRGTRHLIS